MPKTGLTAKELYEKALDAAEDEIRRNGVERLRVIDVARHLKISHAAIYKLFADKESLLDAVSKRWLDSVDQELSRIAAKKGAGEVLLVEWFLTLHQLKREKAVSDPQLFAAFNVAAKKTRPFIATHLKTMFDQLEKIIKAAVKSGDFKCEDAKLAAEILFEATMAFHHPRMVLEAVNTDRTAILKQVLTTLIAGFR